VLTAVATALGHAALGHAALGHAAVIHAALGSGAQPVLPGFLNSLASPLEHFGLWAIFALVLLEDFGIPVPGETVLIAGAIFAGSGQLNVVAVGLVGFVAAVIGDNIGYGIGRFGGRALVERWGKYVFITPERLDKAEDFFKRHGGKIITIARFVEGLRQANGIIAGITDMHWLRFVAFNALGAALWVGTWVSVGYFAGQHITTIYNAITRYSLYAAIAAVVLIAAWVVYRVRKHRRTLADAVQRAAANQETAAQPEAPANQETTAKPEATANQETTAKPEAADKQEAVAPPVAAPGRQTAAGQASGAGDDGRDDRVEADGRAVRDGRAEQDRRGDRQGVAAGEDGSQDRAARRGQGLTGPQDSERS
jgi:membrane protein DedA with SNARE-associated domain